jgi:hypothetical protein
VTLADQRARVGLAGTGPMASSGAQVPAGDLLDLVREDAEGVITA